MFFDTFFTALHSFTVNILLCYKVASDFNARTGRAHEFIDVDNCNVIPGDNIPLLSRVSVANQSAPTTLSTVLVYTKQYW